MGKHVLVYLITNRVLTGYITDDFESDNDFLEIDGSVRINKRHIVSIVEEEIEQNQEV